MTLFANPIGGIVMCDRNVARKLFLLLSSGKRQEAFNICVDHVRGLHYPEDPRDKQMMMAEELRSIALVLYNGGLDRDVTDTFIVGVELIYVSSAIPQLQAA